MAETSGGAGSAGTAGTQTQNGGAGGTAGTSIVVGTPDWTAGLNDDMKGYVQNKGWKSAQEVADSYRNFEKLQGVPQDRILKLPESAEAPEYQAVWEKLGKPKEAKDYKVQFGDGKDTKLADWAKDTFHKSNLTADQANSVMTAWNARQVAEQAQTLENQKIALSQATERLKTEWGAAYEKNMNLAKSGMTALGLDAKTVDLVASVQGADVLFKKLSDIGKGVGEANFVIGRPAADGSVTPEQARAQLEDLKRDQNFVQKYLKGDFDAKKKMEHLMKMAAPGDMRLT